MSSGYRNRDSNPKRFINHNDDDGWGNGPTNKSDNDTSGKRFKKCDDWGNTIIDDNNKKDDNTSYNVIKTNNDDGWGCSERSNNKDDGWGASEQPSIKDDCWGNSDKPALKDDAWGGGGNKRNHKDDGWCVSNQSDRRGDRTGRGNLNEKSVGWCDGAKSGDKGHGWSNDNPSKVDGAKGFGKNEGGSEEEKKPFMPEELDLDEENKLQIEGGGASFKRYNEQKVTCFPPDLIEPVEKFEDVVASKLLLQNLNSQQYTEMTPIQKWAMPAIMAGHDLIGCAETGSGKTAAFLLPVLQNLLNSDLEPHDPSSLCQNPYCLIISPTRELANQIHVQANLLSRDSVIKCHVIYGQIATNHLKAKLQTGCHILVATIGRLKDFVNRGWIGFSNIRYIILDEGDRLVDDGFSGDVKGFFDHETMPPKEKRQTLFFSATFKEETQLQAKAYLRDTFIFLTVGRIGAANLDIKQEFKKVNRQEKKRELKKILKEISDDVKTIIFTQTKSAADILASFFSALNLSSTSIHGDRHQSQREQAIKAFKKGEKRFLISSPVGNRGLDLPNVSLVINYDLPKDIDEYVHRIGRTGRAGHTGRALSFYDEERDTELLPHLLDILKEAKQEIPDWMLNNDAGGFGNSEDINVPSAHINTSVPVDGITSCVADDDGWGNTSRHDTEEGNKDTDKKDEDKSSISQPARSQFDDWGNTW